MHLPHAHSSHHHSLFFFTLHHLICLCSSHFCSQGCDLLHNEAFPCHSNLAFIAKDADINDIHSIITNATYLCFTDPADTVAAHSANDANTDHGIQQRDDWDASALDLSSYVLLWQSLVISLIVPAIALMLFAILRIVFVKLFELVRCRESSKCGCCLALVSAEYRQRRRNRRFDREEVYDEKQSEENGWWRFGANRHRASVEGDNERKEQERADREMADVLQYQCVPLDEEDHEDAEEIKKEERIEPKVIEFLEEVSIERGELDNYLDVPGGGVKGSVELSFSSHGLRQICNREIV